MREYITVAEYAALKGISKQAVYKQLNNQLKEFVIMVENKRYIAITALSDDELAQVEQLSVENSTENSTEFNNNSTDYSTEFIAYLQQQIAEKDKTINALLAQIAEHQQHAAELSQIIQNSQVLHASDKPALLESGNETEKKKRGFLWFKK